MLRKIISRVSTIVTLLLLSVSLTAASSSSGSPVAPSFRVGAVVVTPTPPHAGFNPLTASNSALRANGYPERPPGRKPKWWIEAVSHVHWVYPRFTSHSHHQSGGPPAAKSTPSSTSTTSTSPAGGTISLTLLFPPKLNFQSSWQFNGKII